MCYNCNEESYSLPKNESFWAFFTLNSTGRKQVNFSKLAFFQGGIIVLDDTNEELEVLIVKKRKTAMEVDFHGLRIFVVTLYKENKLQISYREEKKGSSSRKNTNRPLQRQYRVPSGVTLTPDEPLSEDVIFETLEMVMPSFFLPKLFKKHPNLRTEALKLKLIGHYSFIALSNY